MIQKSKKGELHKLFPTCVLEVQDFLTQQECKDVLQKVKEDKKNLKKHNSLLGNAATTYLEQNFLSKLNSAIQSSLLEVGKKYSEIIGFEIQNTFDGSWFNIQNKNSSLKKTQSSYVYNFRNYIHTM